MVGCEFVIGLFCLIFRCFMVETPAYYASKGRMNDAQRILNKICVENTGKAFSFIQNEDKMSLVIEENNTESPKKKLRVSIQEVFKNSFGLIIFLHSFVFGN